MEMTWEKGVLYKISPKKKKSIVDIQFYSMDGDSFIKYTEAYRGGYVTVLGDEMLDYFDIEQYDPEIGVDVWWFPKEDHEFLDGVSNDITFPATLSSVDRKKIETIYSEQGLEGFEDIGWEHTDTEVWFYGDLSIEKIL